MGIAGVVFDMDDTLYLERDYVKSGFQAVAQFVREVVEPEPVFEFLWSLFNRGVRGDTFNRMTERFPILGEKWDINDFVIAYRTHSPTISLMSGMGSLIGRLQSEGIKIGVLSDGPHASQQAKTIALGMYQLADFVMLTDSLGRECWKPSPAGFERLEAEFDLQGADLVYVGDNVDKDFVAPNSLGWETIRLRMEGQLRQNAETGEQEKTPGHEVFSVEALSALLDAMKKGK